MFPIQYAYLTLGILLGIIWLILFLYRKDIRREMLIISIAFGIGGVLAEYVYLKDWWQPLTITNTSIGTEDFLFGFTTGGIASVIYEVISRKKVAEKKATKILSRKHLTDAGIILLLPILFFGSSMYLGFNTLHASFLGYGIPLLFMYVRRKDLIVDSLVSGISLLAIIFVIYTIVEFLSPGWVLHFWTFENVPPIIFWNVPIDDLIWYILTGAFIGIMYEFLQESPLFRLSK